MANHGPSPPASADESPQPDAVVTTHGPSPTREAAEAALRATGLTPERTGEAEWEVAIRAEMDPSHAASLSLPLTSLQDLLPDPKHDGAGKPAKPQGSTSRQPYERVPLQHRPSECTTCDDGGWVRDPAWVLGAGASPVLGQSGGMGNAIPCPDCNSSISSDFLLSRSNVPVPLQGLRLDTYEPRPGNEAARGAAQQWVEAVQAIGPGQCESLLLVGGTGVGKTHLATALVIEACHAGRRAVFHQVARLLRELQDRFDDHSEGTAQSLMKALGVVPVLALDDWGAELKSRSGWSAAELDAVIDERLTWERPTIVTTNLSADEMTQHVEQRSASRLLTYQRIELGGGDMRGRQ